MKAHYESITSELSEEITGLREQLDKASTALRREQAGRSALSSANSKADDMMAAALAAARKQVQ